MKIKIMILIMAVLAGWGITSTTVASLQGKRVKEQSTIINKQSQVIDSLITLPRTQFEVKLSVEDNSKLTVYGKKSENLQVPATKTYVLKLDSVSIKQLNK